MLVRDFPVNLSPGYPLEKIKPLDKILFFDIETTGFSAETTYLYLIGCVYYSEGSFHLIQWFAENINDEVPVLHEFFRFMKNFELLIHFNGSGFDIPYLTKKCRQHWLPYDFDSIESCDLYKQILPFKKLFPFRSFRQKSIELFLDIQRKDTESGGDLIEVYKNYLGYKQMEVLRKSRITENHLSSESEALLDLLLLHNEDDLKGLVLLCPILFYPDLTKEPFHIIQAAVDGQELCLHVQFSFHLPKAVQAKENDISFEACENHALLRVPILEDELKYFHENYQDYFYLPGEDTAIHKSVAMFVDREYREKAKPSNCYTRKTGIFVPQYDFMSSISFPGFRREHKDKLSYLEVHTDFLLQEEILQQYASHLVCYLFRKAKP